MMKENPVRRALRGVGPAPAPNPTTGATRLALTVAEVPAVRAEALRRCVAVVLDGTVSAGTTALVSDASALLAGLYLLRVAR